MIAHAEPVRWAFERRLRRKSRPRAPIAPISLSRRLTYTLGMLIEVALHGDAGRVSLAGYARRHGISPGRLVYAMPDLVRAGILTSSAGQKGGYLLARPAEEITLADVAEAIRKGTRPVLPHAEEIDAVFQPLEAAAEDLLARLTLADLVEAAPSFKNRSESLALSEN